MANQNANYEMCAMYNREAALKVLDGLLLAQFDPQSVSYVDGNDYASPKNEQLAVDDLVTDDVIDGKEYKIADKMSCLTCNLTFSNREDQKEHFRSDWHRHNLKCRMRSKPVMTEEDFDLLAGDVSSISGSDSDSTDDSKSLFKSQSVTNKPKLYFKNSQGTILSIYKSLVYAKKSTIDSSEEIIKTATSLPDRMKWGIFLSGGGHFAAAIYNRDEMVCHKTFHRYVTRAKRGTAQSTHDSASGHARSAGASLRRHNEAALSQEIQELVTLWMAELKSCDLLFIRSSNFYVFKQFFINAKDSGFTRTDARFRSIPFATRRPTLNEVKRVHLILANIEIYGKESDFCEMLPRSPPRRFNKSSHDLEIVSIDNNTDRQEVKKRRRKKKNATLTTDDSKVNVNEELNVSDSSESAEDTTYVITEETVTFDNMKPFEISVPQNKKSTPKRKGRVKAQKPHLENSLKDKMKNDLYTACKTGNLKQLQILLRPLLTAQTSEKYCQLGSNSTYNHNENETIFSENNITHCHNNCDVEDCESEPKFIKSLHRLSRVTSEFFNVVNTSMGKTGENDNRGLNYNVEDLERDASNDEDRKNDVSWQKIKCISDSKDTMVLNTCILCEESNEKTDDLMQVCSNCGRKKLNSYKINVIEDGDIEEDLTLNEILRLAKNEHNVDKVSKIEQTCLTSQDKNSLVTDISKLEDNSAENTDFFVAEKVKTKSVDADLKNDIASKDIELTLGNLLTREAVVKLSGSASRCDLGNVVEIDTKSDTHPSDVCAAVATDVTVSNNCDLEDKIFNKSKGFAPISHVNNVSQINNSSSMLGEIADAVSTDDKATQNNEVLDDEILQACCNQTIGAEKQTILHVAVKHNHKSLVKTLLLAGADPSIQDNAGKVPFNLCKTKDIRNEFRLFRAEYPDKYDYESAQISPPITEEDLTARREHQQQKQRDHQRKKKQRNKIKQAEQKQIQKEDADKARFLALSDREKRALAAERRLLNQTVETNQPTPVLLRCFFCAQDISGKVPFEYYDYKFCTPKCLQQHRLKTKTK